MKRNSIVYIFLAVFLASCSMTKNIPEDDSLFVGLKTIEYPDAKDDQSEEHLENTKVEVEAALATEPNGSLFGSSYYTVPWSWHLWVYNHFSGKESKFSKWMVKSFGRAPILMSQVNPAMRATVAQSVLRNNGYFRSHVDYEIVPMKNPKKSKIRYTVHLDSLFTLDSVSYVNYPASMQQLIDSTSNESLIKKGMPFSAGNLDSERTRISNLMRNNGYFYYSPSDATYLADTFAVEGKSQLRFQLANDLKEEVLRKWYIGNIALQLRKSFREQLTDSIRRRHLTIHFNGKRPPITPSVLLRNLSLRPRQEYNYDKYIESAGKINATGVFSSTDFLFTPRPETDTLDLSINCVFDKPYEFYIEGNFIGRTNGRYGPEMKVGFAKRNLFRGAEKLDMNLHGSYQWQNSSVSSGGNYQYGADVSLEFPRIIAPFYNSDRIPRDRSRRTRRRRFYSAPTTFAKVSSDVMHYQDYYKMHVVSGEWTYRWQTSESSRHEFSPLTVKYQFKNSTTEKYDSLVINNMYLFGTMEDQFTPKMRYTYTYTSPSKYRNPIRWETTVEEAGNIVSLFDMARGRSFNEKEKKLFKTSYSQYLRLETDFTKTWSIGMQSKLVGHINTGVIWSYGNADAAPFSEMFYAGGANSIRAFRVRDIGPGRFNNLTIQNRQLNYIFRNGDLKLIMNLEYRKPLFGNLHGAVFLDAGNVWNIRNPFEIDKDQINAIEEEYTRNIYTLFALWADQTKFKPSEFLNDIAIGTGIGLRYDLGFLVIRVDWGIVLHLPYRTVMDDNTLKRGYFNIGRFKDAQTVNFAIGYPF